VGREGARRLAVAAGSVLAAAVASLPFAGGAGQGFDSLTTVDGPASNAPYVAPAAWRPTPVELASAVPQVPAVVPTAIVEPPPPPPPPEGASLDPAIGVVPGDAASLGPVVVAAPAEPSAPAADPSRPGQRVWAVVVGIDDYPGTRSDLRAATADANDLVTALLQFGVPAEQVRPVYDRAATVDEVLDAVDWLIDHVDQDDTAVFLYAGHVRDLGRGTEAIVTADGGWITDWYLADRFAGMSARDAWFVIAACYGGGFDELLGPDRVLTAGAGPGELAYENDAYGRSYLAEFVLRRGLVEGRAGAPTVQAAVAWAQDELATEHPDRQVWNRDQSDHDISLDGVRRDGSEPPAAPPPAEPAPPPPGDGGLLGGGNCLLGILGTCPDD